MFFIYFSYLIWWIWLIGVCLSCLNIWIKWEYIKIMVNWVRRIVEWWRFGGCFRRVGISVYFMIIIFIERIVWFFKIKSVILSMNIFGFLKKFCFLNLNIFVMFMIYKWLVKIWLYDMWKMCYIFIKRIY